jgi:hypothetical protein
MIAPDSLKTLINNMLDKRWEDILRSNTFYDVEYDPSFNEPCRIKIQFGTENIKDCMDKFVLKISTKYNME